MLIVNNSANSSPRLKRIVTATDAQIVLSSHWRKNPAITNYLFYAFEKLGIPIAVDKTPDLCYDVSCRAKEIHRWLDEHPRFKGNWVVLGEDNDIDVLKAMHGGGIGLKCNETIKYSVVSKFHPNPRKIRKEFPQIFFQMT
jgi:hypothetical protein